MGKHARIAELEREIASLREAACIHDDIRHFLDTLAQMPSDAVLLYALTGQRMIHQIGLSARVLREKIYG